MEAAAETGMSVTVRTIENGESGGNSEESGDNLYTTQTPECTKDKYNVKIVKRKSLLRSHQQPT
jgi:hypothetical protein